MYLFHPKALKQAKVGVWHSALLECYCLIPVNVISWDCRINQSATCCRIECSRLRGLLCKIVSHNLNKHQETALRQFHPPWLQWSPMPLYLYIYIYTHHTSVAPFVYQCKHFDNSNAKGATNGLVWLKSQDGKPSADLWPMSPSIPKASFTPTIPKTTTLLFYVTKL